MKKIGMIGLLAFVGATSMQAKATQGWVQLPGLATQIAVGASDLPYVLDINGNVQYLAPSTLQCGSGLCVQSGRNWVMTGYQASRIAADLYGYLWIIDSAGAISATRSSTAQFSTVLAPTHTSNNITSIAPGHWDSLPSEWNYPFGYSAKAVNKSNGSSLTVFRGTTYITTPSPALLSIDISETDHWNSNGTVSIQLTNNGWQSVDTGELGVAMFTVDGSADQVPWFFHTATSGINVAYAYHSGTYTYASAPRDGGVFQSITYVTDHYVVANNEVFQWLGNAFGGGNAVWSLLPNSNIVPSGGRIVQIAYASALPGTSVGTVGPSNLYMVDSNNFIYQWGDVQSPPK